MNDLIDTGDIAKAMGLKRTYVTDRVVKREDFPAPAFSLSNKTVKWRLAEFEKWLKARATQAVKRSGKLTPGNRCLTAG